jgi:phage terminase large subunit-like protein
VDVSQLESLIEQHKIDPNYQHRDMLPGEMEHRALTSFNRMSEERQNKVIKACGIIGIGDLDLIRRARFMAQTNLFFLCKLLEIYKDMSAQQYVWTDGTVHNTHEEICNDFFVRKDPTQKTFKDFANQYNAAVDKKERLLLVPRGGFKSTMNMADSVQWTLAFPEVTILVLSGVLNLANKFVGEIKGHFMLEECAEAKWANIYVPGKKVYRPRMMDDGTFFVFQALFAEHCIPDDDGKANEFQTPAVSNRQKEPTVFSASIEQSLTGFHVCVLKLDDVVTNENSLTVERLKAVNKQVSINQAMLHPYGFYDKIGTWYDSEDTYGQDIKNAAKYAEDGESFPMKIYIRPCWWPTVESVKAGKIEEEMVESDYNLWFNQPGQLTYEFLKHKKKTDPYFAIKYLNDPTQMHVVKFPRELLIRKTVNAAEVPGTGMIVTCVDTAYSTKSWADYTVIITAMIFGGKFFIIDMKRGRFDEYTLPGMIAATAAQWKPKTICIEDTGKAERYVQREAYREMDKLKIRVPLRMVTLGQGTSKKSKAAKAGPVLRFLGDDRLKFVNTCPSLEELYEELSKFGTAASVHDDIVDALAILVSEFAMYADIDARMQAASNEYTPDPKGKSFYDQVYGLGQYDKYNAHNLQLEFAEQSIEAMAKEAAQDAEFVNNDPLTDLFGG